MMRRGATIGFLLAVLLAATAPTAVAARSCAGKTATIVGTPGNDVLASKKASDVILGLGGNDRISAGSNGNDVICGGAGNDRINGNRGNNVLIGEDGRDRIMGQGGNDKMIGGGGSDRLIGGSGNDQQDGGAGRDIVRGTTGNDRSKGGPGADRVFGDNGNDGVDGGGGDDYVDGGLGDDISRLGGGDVKGGPGTDMVVGGPGVDLVDGGAGDGDVVRGDQGPDEFDGGPGSQDIASFTTASVISNLGWASPGCQNTRGFALVVELSRGVACEFLTPKKILDQPLRGIEDVAGSSYADRIDGDGGDNRIDGGPGDDALIGGGGNDTAFGGSGFDLCSNFLTEDSCPGPRSTARATTVELSRSIDGSRTLVVLGRAGADEITVNRSGGGYVVATNGPVDGTGCQVTGQTANCPVTGLTTILGDTGGGDDRFTVGTSVPAGVRTTIMGNGGSDVIIGGSGADHLEGGADGRDTLRGRGGGDALFGGGNDPDRLISGPGTDLNTLPATCGAGNFINGGPGRDNASYALTDHSDTWVMSLKSNTAGFRRRGCGVDRYRGVSSLEGTKGVDIMIGDEQRNSMLGHGGADTFNGGGGKDYVDARDDARDRTISCGAGKDTLLRDNSDPRGSSC
jgi:Ca2+-binding RTX toxin-like protein